MLFLKYSLTFLAAGLFLTAAALIAYDLWRRLRPRAPQPEGEPPREAPPEELRWRLATALAVLAWFPLLLSLAIVVIPSGMAGVRVSQLSGTLPGTLYAGAHFVRPLIDRVALYDIRDQVFTTRGDEEPAKKGAPPQTEEPKFQVHSREGLAVGLAITVRYRLDPRRLDYIHANLPQPIERELVPPVVTSVFREIVPNYTVREVFAASREDIQRQAVGAITGKLAADGILVKEVMLRDVHLPPEYAKGLEQLLMKEQENEGLKFETEIKEKQVRIAELQAEAAKARQVKQSEADAQSRVLAAKGEADSMQYLLPLKQKQIEQSRLEAQARKEAVVRNAEAQAEAKVIDSRAELERRNLLAEAEANRIRITAAADAERMQSEAAVLKQNPLLINKIMAEKLSDKLQIMMVPTDGRFFFNDLLKGPMMSDPGAAMDATEDPPQSQRARARGYR